MECAEFREALFGQPGPQTRLAQFLHARECANCRADAQDAKRIGKAIRALPRHPAPEGLRQRLIQVADAPEVDGEPTRADGTAIEADSLAAPRRLRVAWSQVLVVAATLLILSAILYPILNLVRQKQASDEEAASALNVCLVNLKNLGLACWMYAEDYDYHLPAAEDWPAAVLPYLGEPADSPLFWCPEDTDATHWPSYAMVPGLSRADLKSVQDRGKHALLYDAEADGSFARRHIAPTGARGGNAGYLDAHAGFSREAPLGVPGHVPEP